ncbi:hypothetical protein BS78_05G274300 [Paspalum vaginatum]|nr:hypothetical protein BS78_05G274300 [Paspalum vaginatum]
MANILFPANFMHKIDSIMRNFWWAGVQDENSTHPIAFRSWDDICKPKFLGGLGLKKMSTVNRSLLLHSAWMIVNGKDPFLTSILKSKYFHNSSFWKCNMNGPKSVFWSSIQGAKNQLVQNCCYQLYTGEINIWTDPWCPDWENIHDHIILPVRTSSIPDKVKDLWYHSITIWNNDLISNLFTEQVAATITQIPVVIAQEPDTLIWKPTKSGQCTTKEAYKCLSMQEQTNIPDQGSRRLTQDAISLMQRIWKNKCLQPKLKTFIWRIIRHAIPTAQRVSTILSRPDNLCKHCSSPENDLHLFFTCPFARVVWFTCNYPMRTDTLPHEEDGLQQTLTALLPPNSNQDLLMNIITTLWYIWRARNDRRFNNRNWTVMQVHYHTRADLQVAQVINDEQKLPSSSTGHSSTQVQQVKCFIDASIPSEQQVTGAQPAGIGIHIKTTQLASTSNIMISAQVQDGVDPLTAETLAMKLAIKIIHSLGQNDCFYYTDSQILKKVRTISRHYLDRPPVLKAGAVNALLLFLVGRIISANHLD